MYIRIAAVRTVQGMLMIAFSPAVMTRPDTSPAR
jgi:hypothetical protein